MQGTVGPPMEMSVPGPYIFRVRRGGHCGAADPGSFGGEVDPFPQPVRFPERCLKLWRAFLWTGQGYSAGFFPYSEGPWPSLNRRELDLPRPTKARPETSFLEEDIQQIIRLHVSFMVTICKMYYI